MTAGLSLVLAAQAYHLARCVESLGRTRVMRALQLDRSTIEQAAMGKVVLSARHRDLVDRLFVQVMLLDGVEPWDDEDA